MRMNAANKRLNCVMHLNQRVERLGVVLAELTQLVQPRAMNILPNLLGLMQANAHKNQNATQITSDQQIVDLPHVSAIRAKHQRPSVQQ
jgi:hypothetical protein